MGEIYRGAFRYYWASLPGLLVFAALIEGALLLFDPQHPNIILLFPTLFVIYQFHRHYLYGERLALGRLPAGAPPVRLVWFLWVSTALVMVPASVAFAVVVSSSAVVETPGRIYGMMLLISAVLYLIALGLFGPVLPALVARRGTFRLMDSLKAAPGTMWRLALGPGIVQVVVFAAGIGLDRLVMASPLKNSETVWSTVAVLATTLSFLPSLLGVAVLCKTYERIAPPKQDHAPA